MENNLLSEIKSLAQIASFFHLFVTLSLPLQLPDQKIPKLREKQEEKEMLSKVTIYEIHYKFITDCQRKKGNSLTLQYLLVDIDH